MIYHIVVSKYDKDFVNNYVLHILDNELKSYSYYLDFANNLLAKHGVKDYFRVVGVEELPVNISSTGYFLFKYRISSSSRNKTLETAVSLTAELLETVGSVAKEDLESIALFKRRRLTLEYFSEHGDSIYEIMRYYDNKPSIIVFEEFYEFPNSAHVRAVLSREVSFSEKMELRGKLLDSVFRVVHDEPLNEIGYEALADALFHRIYRLEKNTYVEYVEKPLFIREINIHPLHSLNHSFETDLFTLSEPDEAGQIMFLKKPLNSQSAYSFMKQYMNSPWRFIVDYCIRSGNVNNVKKLVVSIYSSFKPVLRSYLNQCQFSLENNTVVIRVPRNIPDNIVGLMIGKGGANVKRVEETIGLKIRIETETVSERVELMKKMKSIINKYIEKDELDTDIE